MPRRFLKLVCIINLSSLCCPELRSNITRGWTEKHDKIKTFSHKIFMMGTWSWIWKWQFNIILWVSDGVWADYNQCERCSGTFGMTWTSSAGSVYNTPFCAEYLRKRVWWRFYRMFLWWLFHVALRPLSVPWYCILMRKNTLFYLFLYVDYVPEKRWGWTKSPSYKQDITSWWERAWLRLSCSTPVWYNLVYYIAGT